jgi:hypothetical protein
MPLSLRDEIRKQFPIATAFIDEALSTPASEYKKIAESNAKSGDVMTRDTLKWAIYAHHPNSLLVLQVISGLMLRGADIPGLFDSIPQCPYPNNPQDPRFIEFYICARLELLLARLDDINTAYAEHKKAVEEDASRYAAVLKTAESFPPVAIPQDVIDMDEAYSDAVDRERKYARYNELLKQAEKVKEYDPDGFPDCVIADIKRKLLLLGNKIPSKELFVRCRDRLDELLHGKMVYAGDGRIFRVDEVHLDHDFGFIHLKGPSVDFNGVSRDGLGMREGWHFHFRLGEHAFHKIGLRKVSLDDIRPLLAIRYPDTIDQYMEEFERVFRTRPVSEAEAKACAGAVMDAITETKEHADRLVNDAFVATASNEGLHAIARLAGIKEETC